MKLLPSILLTILLSLWCSGLSAAEMVTVELEPGIHRLPTVTVPTRFVATKRWRAILEPADDLPYCLNLYADCEVVDCQIRFATSDKGSKRVSGGGTGVFAHSKCKRLTLIGCWVHHCTDNGVYASEETLLRMDRCLVERCGSQTQWSHALYVSSYHFEIMNSLFLHNSNKMLECQNPKSTGVIYRCVSYADGRNRTILFLGKRDGLSILRCTLFGDPPERRTADGLGWELIPLHRSNLSFPHSQDKVDEWFLAYPHYHLFVPSERMTPPRGAFDYYPELHTRKQAEVYWRNGCADGWGDDSYVSQHPFPFPMFPGDKRPELK